MTNKNQRYSLKVNGTSDNPLPSPIISTPIFVSLPPSILPRVRIRNPRAQRLQLYESNATPKIYACYTKYSAPNQSSLPEVLAPLGSSFELAFSTFKQFFTLKTRKEWDDRLIKAVMGDEAFVYTPPKEGQPRGMVLPGTVQEGGMFVDDGF